MHALDEMIKVLAVADCQARGCTCKRNQLEIEKDDDDEGRVRKVKVLHERDCPATQDPSD